MSTEERQTRSQRVDTTALEDIENLNAFIVRIIELRDSIPREAREGATICIRDGRYEGDVEIDIDYSRPETDEEFEKRIATKEELAKLSRNKDLAELERLQIKLGVTK